MKKMFVFVLVSLFVLSTASFAQPQFGVKLGLNISSAKISPMDNGVSKTSIAGLIAGGSVGFRVPSIDENAAIRCDVSYTLKGAKETWDGGSAKFTYDELDFSPFAVYHISGLTGVDPYVQIGPELGFVLSNNEHIQVDGYGSKDEDIQHAESMDFSLNIGAGVGLPLNNRGEVIFDLRYCLGLSNMDDRSDYTAKAHGVQLAVGYNFPPKK